MNTRDNTRNLRLAALNGWTPLSTVEHLDAVLSASTEGWLAECPGAEYGLVSFNSHTGMMHRYAIMLDNDATFNLLAERYSFQPSHKSVEHLPISPVRLRCPAHRLVPSTDTQGNLLTY